MASPARSTLFQPRRRGMTLMEVIVAMAIFLMALTALVPLTNLGLMHATEVELQALGLQKAQSKMSEVMAGGVPLGSQSSVPFEEDVEQKWTWSMDAEQDTVINNLWLVTITVSYPVGDTKVEVKLTEKVRDPSILAPWASNQLPTVPTTNTNPNASTTSSSTTSSSSSKTGSGAATKTGGATTGGASTPAPSSGGGGGGAMSTPAASSGTTSTPSTTPSAGKTKGG